ASVTMSESVDFVAASSTPDSRRDRARAPASLAMSDARSCSSRATAPSSGLTPPGLTLPELTGAAPAEAAGRNRDRAPTAAPTEQEALRAGRPRPERTEHPRPERAGHPRLARAGPAEQHPASAARRAACPASRQAR